MAFNPGAVLLLEWPNSKMGYKKRPVVVISSAAYNGRNADVVVASITAQERTDEEDLPFGAGDPEFSGSGLKCDSWIRCGKIYTFDLVQQAHQQLGSVGPRTLEAIRARLRELLI